MITETSAQTVTAGAMRQAITDLKTAAALKHERVSLPILAHALLTCDGGILRIEATNLELWVSVTLPAPGLATGSIATPLASLDASLARLPKDAAIHLALCLDQECLEIRSVWGVDTIHSMHAEEFPLRPPVDDSAPSCVVPAVAFRALLDSVTFAAMKPTRDNLGSKYTGVLTRLCGLRLSMAAMDHHRLARNTTPISSYTADLPPRLLPVASLARIAKRLPKQGDVTLTFGAEWARIQTDQATWYLAYGGVEETGAPYWEALEDFIAADHFARAARITLPTQLLRDAVAAVEMPPDASDPYHTLRLSLTAYPPDERPSELRLLTTREGQGEKTRVVPCTCDGAAPAPFHVNRVYLAQALAQMTAPECVLVVPSPRLPIRVEAYREQPEYMQVIMPLFKRG